MPDEEFLAQFPPGLQPPSEEELKFAARYWGYLTPENFRLKMEEKGDGVPVLVVGPESFAQAQSIVESRVLPDGTVNPDFGRAVLWVDLGWGKLEWAIFRR